MVFAPGFCPMQSDDLPKMLVRIFDTYHRSLIKLFLATWTKIISFSLNRLTNYQLRCSCPIKILFCYNTIIFFFFSLLNFLIHFYMHNNIVYASLTLCSINFTMTSYMRFLINVDDFLHSLQTLYQYFLFFCVFFNYITLSHINPLLFYFSPSINT